MTDTNPLDQPAVFTERMRRQIARGAEYSEWNGSGSRRRTRCGSWPRRS